MEYLIKKKTALFIPVIIFLLFSAHIRAEELTSSPYYSLKTEEVQKNSHKITDSLLKFHEIFISCTDDRYTEAEAKGFSQERYVFFKGKLIENALYVSERGTEAEKYLKNIFRNDNITLYGIIKTSDRIIIEISKIEKGWNIKKYDTVPLPKKNSSDYENSLNQKNMLKVPYRQEKKKYKLYIPF